MQEIPEVVGLILNYRDAARTGKCVRSLLENGVEHVLVWDNSEDDGASARLLEKEFQSDERISVHVSPYNTGFALGVNRGIEKIRLHHSGPLLLLMNNDAIIPPESLRKLVGAFQNDDDLLIAYPSIEQHGKITGKSYYNRWSGILSRRHLLGSFAYPCGCCLLISLKKLNPGQKLLDESFFMYGEDTELGFRLPPRAIAHVPEATVIHEGSASSKLGSVFYENSMAAAHWLLAQKLAKNKLEKFAFHAVRFFLLPTRAAIRAFRFKSLVPLKALREGWRIAHGGDPMRKKPEVG